MSFFAIIVLHASINAIKILIIIISVLFTCLFLVFETFILHICMIHNICLQIIMEMPSNSLLITYSNFKLYIVNLKVKTATKPSIFFFFVQKGCKCLIHGRKRWHWNYVSQFVFICAKQTLCVELGTQVMVEILCDRIDIFQ